MKKYINLNYADPAITSSNGEIQKAIDFKIKKMLGINIDIENTSNNNSTLEFAKINNTLKSPMANKTFKQILDNYYYGLFYDGIVYFLKFENGFYIARENEVIIQNNVLSFNNLKPISWTTVENIDYSTNGYRPQFKEIELTLQKKYYTELLTVKALDRGTIIQNVLIDKSGIPVSDEESSKMRQRILSIFGFTRPKYQAPTSSWAWDENDSATLILSGNWEHKSEKVSINDISNDETISNCRDYIFNFLGVPPQLMGSSKSSTYSNYREAMLNFLQNTVVPDLKVFIDLINANFLDDSAYKLEVDEIDIPEFIEYKKSNFNMLNQLYSEGIITADEFLESSGFDEFTNGEGG